MIDNAQDDLSRYYGDTKPVNGLGVVDGRSRPKPAAEFIQAAFALCAFAKGRPWATRMNVMIAIRQLRLLARHDSPALREIAMRSLARVSQ